MHHHDHMVQGQQSKTTWLTPQWDIPDPCASTTDGPNIAYYYAIGEILR
jgi:hypothetical protein